MSNSDRYFTFTTFVDWLSTIDNRRLIAFVLPISLGVVVWFLTPSQGVSLQP